MGKGPVRRRSGRVAAVAEIITVLHGVAIDEAPSAAILLGRVAGWASEEFLGRVAAAVGSACKVSASTTAALVLVVSSTVVIAVGASVAASKASATKLRASSATAAAAARLRVASIVRLHFGDKRNRRRRR